MANRRRARPVQPPLPVPPFELFLLAPLWDRVRTVSPTLLMDIESGRLAVAVVYHEPGANPHFHESIGVAKYRATDMVGPGEWGPHWSTVGRCDMNNPTAK